MTRVLADTVDAARRGRVLALGYLGVAAVRFLWRSWAFTFPTPPFLLMLVLGGLTAVLYLTATWGTTGRSYGKHLLGLRVVGPFGRLRLGGALVRSLLCVLFPIGVAWVVVSRHNRSLQDTVLRTSVVYDWLGGDDEPSPAPPSPAPLPPAPRPPRGRAVVPAPSHPPGRTAEPTAPAEHSGMTGTRGKFAAGVLAVSAALTMTACGESAQARACDRSDGVRSAVENLRDVNSARTAVALAGARR